MSSEILFTSRMLRSGKYEFYIYFTCCINLDDVMIYQLLYIQDLEYVQSS